MDFKNGLNDLLEKAQEMQKSLESAQKELMDLEATGEAGSEPINVKVTLAGPDKVKRVYISQALLREEKEVIEDMLASAFNAAMQNMRDLSQKKMQDIMGNMKMPEGFPFPFGGDQQGQG